MYESFFRLREPPFSLAPDPRFLWPSETHLEGLNAILYGITARKGFVLLTGDVGTGKTTLLRAVLERLPPDTQTGVVFNTSELQPLDLLRLIADELGIEERMESKSDYTIALNSLLIDRMRSGVNTVLIIDEAQDLECSALQELRQLSNLETDTEKLLQIVLTGQPELRAKLAAPRLRSLRQRIALEHHIEPLLPLEVFDYLRHRIQAAGGCYEEVFAPGAEESFFSFSSGCPRLINLLADRSLLSAFSRQLRPVPCALVELKAKEIAAAQRGGGNGNLDLSQTSRTERDPQLSLLDSETADSARDAAHSGDRER